MQQRFPVLLTRLAICSLFFCASLFGQSEQTAAFTLSEVTRQAMASLLFMSGDYSLRPEGLVRLTADGKSTLDLLRVTNLGILSNGTVVASNPSGAWLYRERWIELASPSDFPLAGKHIIVTGNTITAFDQSGIRILTDPSVDAPPQWQTIHTPKVCQKLLGVDIANDRIELACSRYFTFTIQTPEDNTPLNPTFASLDRGLTWLPTGSIDKWASDENISVDDDDARPDFLFCIEQGSALAFTRSHLLLRKQGDAGWSDITPQYGFSGDAFWFHGNIVAHIYGSWWVSKDCGSTWNTPSLPDITVSDGTRALGVYAPTSAHAHVVMSGNRVDIHLPDAPFVTVRRAALNGDVVALLGTDSIAILNMAQGEKWTLTGQILPAGTDSVRMIAGQPTLMGPDVYRHDLHTRTWVKSPLPHSGWPYRLVWVDSTTGDMSSGRSYLAGDQCFKTTDGNLWTEVRFPKDGQIVAFTKGGGKTYVVKRLPPDSFDLVTPKPELIYSSQDDTHWTEVMSIEFRLGPAKGIAVDSQDVMFVMTSAHLLKIDSGSAPLDIAGSQLLGARLKSLTIGADDVLFAQTDRGLYWSRDSGGTWETDTRLGKAAVQFPPVQQPRAFPVVINERGYIMTSNIKSERAFEVPLGFSLPSSSSVISVKVDSVLEKDLQVDRAADGTALLRGKKEQLSKYKDGLHRISVNLATASQHVSQEAYIYKELAQAHFYQAYGNSYAIVIAASGFWDTREFSYLDEAVHQAKEVASYLEHNGFKVTPLYEGDANLTKINAAIDDLVGKVRPEDRVLFYFSGHGDPVVNEGTGEPNGYLLTYPAKVATLATQGLPMYKLQDDYGRRLQAKHVLFVVDACYSGLALGRSNVLNEFYRYEELANYTNKYVRVTLAAGTKDETSLDKNGGIFTKAFLEAVEGAADRRKNGIITAADIYAYVSGRVSDMAADLQSHQTPQIGRQGEGEFVFLTSGH